MSTGENAGPTHAVVGVIGAGQEKAGAAGSTSSPESGQPAGTAPIVLPPTSQETLVQAIQRAAALGVPLLLQPGTYFTKPGRAQRIPIGANGLQIRPADPPGGQTGQPIVIKRPDHSIDTRAPDDNYGLFFIPAPPTPAELAGITTWKPFEDSHGPFEFAVVIRGQIAITGVTVDCNMGQQKLETLDKDMAEHSAMLGFAGQQYPAPPSPTGARRFVYVGFESVGLDRVHTLNGGFADDVWFTRGYFNPNIELVDIRRFTSTNRIDPRRASIGFSAVCQNVRIADADVYSLHLEETSGSYSDLPRQSDIFKPSVWELSGIKAQFMALAAKGKVFVLDASDLTTTEGFTLYEAGGVVRSSRLRAGAETRLFRLNDLVFDHVTWILDPDKNGRVLGLRPTAQYGAPCTVTFLDNIFVVNGSPTAGEIITSEYSRVVPDNRVTVTATGCTYPDAFGRRDGMFVALVLERGDWTFAIADFGDRDLKKAIVKGPQTDIVLHLV